MHLLAKNLSCRRRRTPRRRGILASLRDLRAAARAFYHVIRRAPCFVYRGQHIVEGLSAERKMAGSTGAGINSASTLYPTMPSPPQLEHSLAESDDLFQNILTGLLPGDAAHTSQQAFGLPPSSMAGFSFPTDGLDRSNPASSSSVRAAQLVQYTPSDLNRCYARAIGKSAASAGCCVRMSVNMSRPASTVCKRCNTLLIRQRVCHSHCRSRFKVILPQGFLDAPGSPTDFCTMDMGSKELCRVRERNRQV